MADLLTGLFVGLAFAMMLYLCRPEHEACRPAPRTKGVDRA